MERLKQELARENEAKERQKTLRQEELARHLDERHRQTSRGARMKAVELERER